MGLLDILKGKKKEQAATHAPEAGKSSVPEKKVEPERGKLLKSKKQKVKKTDKKQKPELTKAAKKDTKNAYRYLLKPIVTEKSTATGTYLFMVDSKANKQEIKKSIESVYGVKPRKVNMMNFGGRKVRWGKSSGQTKSWKKAVVYLNEGDKIEIYEGV